MKAWTVRQPFASLIVRGAMPYWICDAPVRASLIGERVVVWAEVAPCDPGEIIRLYENIHFEGSAGTGIAFDGASHLIATIRADHEQGYRISRVPLARGIGTVVLGRSVPLTEVFPNDQQVDPSKWAWPLVDAAEFERPVSVRFNIAGFWDWPAKAVTS
jgi:hypothetical protein